MDKTFIFDLDDTLIVDQSKYSYTQIEFMKFLVDRIGHRSPDVQTIINLFMDMDKRAVESKGFSKDRFPSSLREAYRHICNSLNFVDERGQDEAYRIGMRVFDEVHWKHLGIGGFIRGSEEILDFLASQGDELMLLTKGDYSVQKAKIDLYGLEKWFGDKIHVVPRKNKEIVNGVVGDRNKSRVWHVGNSIRSDVLPAIDAKIGAIYIPCETWAYEREHGGIPENPRLLVFRDISDIKSNYPSII